MMVIVFVIAGVKFIERSFLAELELMDYAQSLKNLKCTVDSGNADFRVCFFRLPIYLISGQVGMLTFHNDVQYSFALGSETVVFLREKLLDV